MKENNYISPTRGFVSVGDKSSNTGFQVNASASWETYRTLERIHDRSFYRITHTAFYVGLLPLFTLPFMLYFFLTASSFRQRIAVLLASLALFYTLGAAESFPVPIWTWMKEIPFFGAMRHSFFYARVVTILLVVLAIETFREASFKFRHLSSAFFLVLLIVHLANLCLFSIMTSKMLIKIPSPHFASIHYPSKWKLYGKESSLIPWDLSPMVLKESTLFHAKPNFTFQLNSPFVTFLRGVNRKELYFYDGVPVTKNKKEG